MCYRRWGLMCGLLGVVWAAGLRGQEPPDDPAASGAKADSKQPAGKENPFTQPSDARQGQQLFRAFCSRCHGRDAKGGKGPNLTTGVFKHAQTDEELLGIMTNGIPGTGMPGFPGDYETENWQIVAFLRSEAAKNAGQQAVPKGNLTQGSVLFKKHNCATCHWIGSEGGRRGTDLSRSTATVEHVRKSLTNPNAQVDVNGKRQAIQVITVTGAVLNGQRLYENGHYVLFIDEQETLHAISKAEIEILHRPDQSLMPSYAKELSPQELDDLTTYVFSLRREPPK